MIESPQLLYHYNRLLKEEGLDPRSVGQDPTYFDEVPLYSRDSQVTFLKGMRRSEQERTLLWMAVRFWTEAEANLIALKYRRRYMNFLSIWGWAHDELPMPYFSFCGSDLGRITGLRLSAPSSKFSYGIRDHLSQLGLGSAAVLYEALEAVPGDVCVVVDFNLPCSPRKVLVGSSLPSMRRGAIKGGIS
jgi:hypothetical protein